jgi:transposase InsO family protein
MKKNSDSSSQPSGALASSLALARYDAVRWIEEAVKSGLNLSQALRSASQRTWGSRAYSIPSLERWYYAYRAGGFGALEDNPRADKGQIRAASPETVEALLGWRRDYPQVNITTLIRQMESAGVIEPGALSMTTVYRILKKAGLDPRQIKAAGAATGSGPTKAFEVADANHLWMTDSMHGPRLSGVGRVYLLALLDDCSRLCPHAQYYLGENLEHFLDTLQHALRGRGIPDRLYTDNGKIFTSHHLQTVCANLGIQLLHHKPYQAWSKGKIERLFLSIQTDFEQRLIFNPVDSLDELNRRFWHWLETEYHRRPHKGLDGQTPLDRFAERSHHLRLLDPQMDIDGLFLARKLRRVRRDATFSLDGRVFEAPVALRGRQIEVRYQPFTFARVEIHFDGQFVARAIPCDKQLNSRSFDKENYENLD